MALVTGGSRSIGAGIAKGLAEHGARVVVNFHSDEAAAADESSDIWERSVAPETVDGPPWHILPVRLHRRRPRLLSC